MKELEHCYNIPPSEHNQFLIDSLDIIIARIAENYTFPKMLADLTFKKVDVSSAGYVFDQPSFNGHFQDWLEYNFQSIFRAPTMGMVPTRIAWFLGFQHLVFKVSKRSAMDLFLDDMEFCFTYCKNTNDTEYPLIYTCRLYYDLNDEKFQSYL